MREFADRYFNLLNNEYAGINLTRINDPDEFWSKQIEDSIAPFEQIDTFKQSLLGHKLHLDIGFGGGFPLLPLAFLNPDFEFHGFEARGKKAKVVQEISEHLGLNNVNCHHLRIENLLIDVPCSISFKAVGKVYDFLSLINTTNKVNVFFYKGPSFDTTELDQFEKAKNDWSVLNKSELDVQGTEKRYIIGFENKKVPHGTLKNKNLVKLSSLIKAKKDSHGQNNRDR